MYWYPTMRFELYRGIGVLRGGGGVKRGSDKDKDKANKRDRNLMAPDEMKNLGYADSTNSPATSKTEMPPPSPALNAGVAGHTKNTSGFQT